MENESVAIRDPNIRDGPYQIRIRRSHRGQ